MEIQKPTLKPVTEMTIPKQHLLLSHGYQLINLLVVPPHMTQVTDRVHGGQVPAGVARLPVCWHLLPGPDADLRLLPDALPHGPHPGYEDEVCRHLPRLQKGRFVCNMDPGYEVPYLVYRKVHMYVTWTLHSGPKIQFNIESMLDQCWMLDQPVNAD